MIFKRRDNRFTLSRFKDLVIPRKGWRRAVDYIIFRVKRLPDTPHKIATGIAVGVFCSFTPFFGLHVFLAILLAYLLNGNIVAALLGTFFGNPITWPFIASFSIKLGQITLGSTNSSSETSLEQIVEAMNAFMQGVTSILGYGTSDWPLVYSVIKELFFPYFVGGFILGLATALVTYFIFRPIIYAYKAAKAKKRLKEKSKSTSLAKKKLNGN